MELVNSRSLCPEVGELAIICSLKLASSVTRGYLCYCSAACAGAIPEALGALGELQKLRLSSNKLTGESEPRGSGARLPRLSPPTQLEHKMI